MAAMTYQRSGVDLEGTNRILGALGGRIRSTHGPEVLPDRGQYAGLFRLSRERWRSPILVCSADGVGTKLKVAQMLQAHDGIGVDVVAMNVNDVLAYGATPIIFLDYLAMGRVRRELMASLLRGIVEGCRQSRCALLGGETAEMPGVYADGEYDVAGFCVGAVERNRLLDGSRVRAGDVVVGLASSGVHANGFSLIRRVFGGRELRRLKESLMAPTRIYVRPVLALVSQHVVTAIAHVTGGGLARRLESLAVVPSALTVRWEPGRWPVPRIFRLIQQAGRLSNEEMYATFNMGIGMAVACRRADAGRVLARLARLRLPAWVIGSMESRD